MLASNKCLHNTYIRLFLCMFHPFKLKGICENALASSRSSRAFLLPHWSFFHLVIFRFIRHRPVRSFVRCSTISNPIGIYTYLKMCEGDARCFCSHRKCLSFQQPARWIKVSLVIRFNLRFAMKLTQTLSTVQQSWFKALCRKETISRARRIQNCTILNI